MWFRWIILLRVQVTGQRWLWAADLCHTNEIISHLVKQSKVNYGIYTLFWSPVIFSPFPFSHLGEPKCWDTPVVWRLLPPDIMRTWSQSRSFQQGLKISVFSGGVGTETFPPGDCLCRRGDSLRPPMWCSSVAMATLTRCDSLWVEMWYVLDVMCADEPQKVLTDGESRCTAALCSSARIRRSFSLSSVTKWRIYRAEGLKWFDRADWIKGSLGVALKSENHKNTDSTVQP